MSSHSTEEIARQLLCLALPRLKERYLEIVRQFAYIAEQMEQIDATDTYREVWSDAIQAAFSQEFERFKISMREDLEYWIMLED